MKLHFGKQLTERERRGSADPSRKWGGRVGENYDGPGGFEPWCRRRNPDYGKSFSDVLGPLRRFLRRSVGRHWDDVYKELGTLQLHDTMTGRHLLQHLEFEVKVECYLAVDGNVYEGPAPAKWTRIKRPKYPQTKPIDGVYVHPHTRRLCYAPYKRDRHRPPAPKDQVIIAGTEYRLDNGIWYAAQVTKLNPDDIIKYEVARVEGIYIDIDSRNIVMPDQVQKIGKWFMESVLKDGRTVNLRPIYRRDVGPHEIVVRQRQIGKKELRIVRAALGL